MYIDKVQQIHLGRDNKNTSEFDECLSWLHLYSITLYFTTTTFVYTLKTGEDYL